ncbi:MAG TPA: tetraacyldisaccharide 4'-kinase [Steroidobacteraceae bacterium]|nr:tetraacyldisaccharide 4'-kinase [Steroidobacteraceae bacterium]
MQQRLNQLWYGARAPLALLAPFGWLYAAAVAARRRAYAAGWLARASPGVPVIVVGNLTVGGTGKTPLTVWLAAELRARGLRVGLLSRGYGRSEGAPRVVSADSDWSAVGDEPLILARRSGCDTVVAADRLAGARLLVGRGARVIVADDGLQHLRLARECEIVVVDGARGFGNERLLPVGPLREPLSALARADLVVVNGAREHASLGRLHQPLAMTLRATGAVHVDGGGGPRALAEFAATPVHAVAGIGNPGRFFRELRAYGLEVREHPFADHHAFSAADLNFGDELPVLMTEKDAVKCAAFATSRMWYVPVTAEFSATDRQILLSRVLARIGDRATGGPS